ncbi:GTP cyclohydrolase II [Alienimonas chondri]|uniref:GTP cyclohydrolase-2 n=1 Tax=Alienimonas chondri TaxID=2681879 RepID=A0ABX1VBE3_9PLAN|nr:GTP cyclohydrolase II [Alienimonas chondri]NNJ24617.1 Riboflavin biosynthesis protein RibBA [Alienimonas chondri]
MSESATPERRDSIEDALAALKAGRAIIVVDAHERENEGDFVAAASTITADTVDFMVRHGRGVLCAPVTKETAERLDLRPIVEESANTAPHRTPFMVQIDHVSAGTGVSPEARAGTLREMANPRSVASDFVKPGHIFPLLAKPGGVLRRAGHTEAVTDLMALAGLPQVGCLIEIVSSDGRGMARGEELQRLAAEHGTPVVSIEDLIKYRTSRERLVTREAEVPIPTRQYGTPTVIAYRVEHQAQEPVALVWGDLSEEAGEPPLVRMHSSCFTGDLIDSLRCDCGDQLHLAMTRCHEAGRGAVVYLPQEGRGIGLTAKLKAYELQDAGADTVEANHKLGFKADQRDYMVGLQILKDLGLTQIRLLTNNPKKRESFVSSAMGLEVVEQVPIIAPPEPTREKYLATKREKMGHELP